VGAGNVKAAYALWGDLPDGAFRLLAFMAVTALDEDTPRYFGGRESLAYGMGWAVEDASATDPAAIAKRESAFKSVKRLTGILKKAGAIHVLRAAAPGRTAEYGLNLRGRRPSKEWDRSRPRGQKNDPHSTPDENAPTDPHGPSGAGNGANSFDGTGPKELAERGQVNRRTGPTYLAPEEEEEQERSRREDKGADVDLTSHPSRATPPTNSRAPVIQLFRKPSDEPLPSLAWRSRRDHAADAIAESMARVEARRAAHQAQLAAGGEP
jgi:hypothetical protein